MWFFFSFFQNAQHSSGVKDMITTTTLRTVELGVITFSKF